jgi:hypothetical protein
VIASLTALGRVLQRAPVAPTSVAALLEGHEGYLAFCGVVREVFPDAEAAILGATEPGDNRESARVWAFLQRVELEYFPVYELDEYDQVACSIPFVRNAWGYDRFHELDLRPGELLVFALCTQPYETGYDSRVPLLAAAEAHVPPVLLSEIPSGGFTPAELRERLAGTPYAAAAEYADWLWSETDSVFLDIDEETEADIEWTRENVLELAAQWQRARDILDGIAELTRWLEADPPVRFARLLDAALGRDAHLSYESARRYYACELTEQGLLPIPHDAPVAVALPLGAAS